MEMDDNKRRRNMILYVLIAFVVYLVLSTVLFPNIGHTQQITKTDYSTFVKALDKKSVDKVEYNTDDYTIYYTKKGEDENIAYKTTGVPNDAGFTDRVLESGASLESVVPDKNSGLMTYYLLTLILHRIGLRSEGFMDASSESDAGKAIPLAISSASSSKMRGRGSAS